MVAQCALPVFENLLPEPHNSVVLGLLHLLCCWHGLAKLQLHTDKTLEIMDGITYSLGNALRKFATDTCAAFSMHKLKREALGCHRQKTQAHSSATLTCTSSTAARQPKMLNLCTYRLHMLGDYTSLIRMFGCTDSYSTQPVSTHCSGVFFSDPNLFVGGMGTQSWKNEVYTYEPQGVHLSTDLD